MAGAAISGDIFMRHLQAAFTAGREENDFQVAFTGRLNLFSDTWPRPRRAGLCGYKESPLKERNKGGHAMTIKHAATILAVALGVAVGAAAPAAAQEGAKLYVFTSGSLGGFPKAALQMGGQGNIDWAPVSFYVLKHPKGNVIIDT